MKNDLVDMLTGKAGFETTIKLDNVHEYTVNINGKWCAVTPCTRTWTQEEINDPSMGKKEYEFVRKLAYEKAGSQIRG